MCFYILIWKYHNMQAKLFMSFYDILIVSWNLERGITLCLICQKKSVIRRYHLLMNLIY